jgi:competence protein ComEA
MKKGLKTNLTSSQLRGMVLFAFSALIISSLSFLYRDFFRACARITYGNQSKNLIAVEVDGNVRKGVFFFPKGIRLKDLLKLMDLENISKKYEARSPNALMILNDGIKITIIKKNNDDAFVRVGNIDASTRLGLNRAIDINSASIEDLILVPGIGEKTAKKIIDARKKLGKFRQVEDIMKIKGIKQKRFEKLKKYLYVGVV